MIFFLEKCTESKMVKLSVFVVVNVFWGRGKGEG